MTLLECAERIRAIFSNPRTLEKSWTETRHFTRSRKMTFARLLEYLLHGSKGAMQSVLNEFFQRLEEEIHMMWQVLSKARSHFDHSPFLKAFYEVVNAEYNLSNDPNLQHRYGYKFLAIDGSVIPLPNLLELKKLFEDVKGSPSAQADIILDVLKDRIHMEDAVFLFDLGYPSKELIEAIL